MKNLKINLSKKEIIRYSIIAFFVFVIIVIAVLVNYGIFDNKESEVEVVIEESENIEEKVILRRKIDGQIVDSEDKINKDYPIAIMIENAADSWPLTGVDKAKLVIEAITEASITRFVTIYTLDDEVEKIGPVRSARPYYLDWIEPFSPLYMHVGGAPQALSKLRSGTYDIIDHDQFFHYYSYWRDKWRYAPHNVYTSTELMEKALKKRELTEPVDFTSWQYKYDLVEEERPGSVQDITVLYTNTYYRVDWEYDRENNDYLRYQSKKVQKMSDGEVIKVKNIIVQVNAMSIIDNVGRKKIETVGEGKAWFFRDGQVIQGTWEKESINDRERYLDDEGNELEFNAGKTWIQIIPDEDYLRY